MVTLPIAIEYLGPVILTEPSRPGAAEWPPAPSRLYAALVAAVHTHDLGDEVLAAVRTLEDVAPTITASGTAMYPPHTDYVPKATNANLALPNCHQNDEQKTQEIVPDSPRVVYHWPVPETATAGIAQAARCLHSVGRGESLVIGDVLPREEAPPVTFAPDRTGTVPIRVPERGRYETLQRDYLRGRATPVIDVTVPYGRVAQRLPTGPWSELLALALDAPISMRSAARVTEALRKAVLAVLGDEAHAQIHGHGNGEHIAWAALPNVGHAHADGRILGVGAWLPSKLAPEARQQIGRALQSIRSIKVYERQMGVGLPRRPSAALNPGTWTGAARVWASVTPMVLDHRISNPGDARRTVISGIARAGYPRPARAIVSQVSAVPGSDSAAATRPRKSLYPRRHAVIEFNEPIAGPVLAGCERYFGLGLFRPIG